MSFYSGYNQPGRRGYSPVLLFVVGLIGVLCGTLLLYAFNHYLGWPGYSAPPGEQGKSGEEQLGQEDPGEEDYPPVTSEDQAKIEVVERIAPAVVGVSNSVYVNRFGQRALVESGKGTGVVISADGYIVTNQHVIDGADVITVVFSNSVSATAKLVGEDALTDLALLKVDKDSLPYVKLGDSSKTRVGETAIAIGNPLGYFQQTVTVGSISAKDRQVRISQSQYAYTYIQTDAAINSGNSGGPLVNLRGEVIGINSAKVSNTGVEGIGFAIPSNTVKRVVKDLQEYGRVRRPQIGIVVSDYRDHTGVPTDRGVYINEVISGGPGEKAGLKEGDVVTAVGGVETGYLALMFDALLEYYPGQEVQLTILRDGKEHNLSVTLGEM